MFAEAVYAMGDHDVNLKFKYDDVTMNTKLILTRFGSTFGTLRFTERSFLNTVFCFTPFWDYKPTNAIQAVSPGVYTSEKILKLKTIDKIHCK